MHHAARRRALAGALAGMAAMASLVCPVWAAPPAVADGDANDIRAVIEAQLAAFRADDAELAFSFASPAIRAKFGVAGYFMAMVRGAYPVVYRPESVSFLLAQIVDDDVIQRVRMTDRGGAAWLAIYRMQRQSDRQWRIDACVVTRDNAQTA